MRIHLNFILVTLIFGWNQVVFLKAQTFGPNNPTSGTNTTSIGSNAWTNPGNNLSSNNSYATVATKGVSNYLSATNFGFTLPATTAITGIQLDIEKSTISPTVVTILNNWTNGNTKTISAGAARCLLVAVFTENGNSIEDVTAMTYGGQSMTQVTEYVVGNSGAFNAKIEIWRLMEAGIAAASHTTITPTFAAATLTQNFEVISSAVFSGVDQLVPVSSISGFSTTSASATVTLSPTLATTEGGLAVSTIICGQNTTPTSTLGGANAYLINSGFTEVIDTYSANAGFTTSGACFQIANKSIATAGTEAPTYTFAGTPNRQSVLCVNLQCIRELDNSVRLIKSGTITGNDYAQTTSAWRTSDTYTAYGSTSDLWGTTWTVAEVNATNFGAVLSASVNNGTARVDHMRITITGFSTLPVELLDFYGEIHQQQTYLNWQTASEQNNREFIIEKSDGITDFKKIGSVAGKLNSKVFNTYNFIDPTLNNGLCYYRLKQVDLDESFKYSKIIALDNYASENMISVYPNPSYDGRFTIAAAEIIYDGIYIYSLDLKLLKKIESNNAKALNFSIQDLADGAYYLIIKHGEEQHLKRIEKFCSGR